MNHIDNDSLKHHLHNSSYDSKRTSFGNEGFGNDSLDTYGK